MPAPKTVAELKANILRPALTSHYSVSITPPPPAKNFIRTNSGTTFDTEFLEISCCEASLPGSSLATIDIVNDYVGVSEKHAYRRLYDDRADFTFYVDHDYRPIRVFESWMKYISQEATASGVGKRTFTSRPTWPNNYCTDELFIDKFERDHTGALRYRFIKAFPVSINSMPVSYDTSNLLKVTVSFVYSRYYIVGFNETQLDNPTSANSAETFNNPQFGSDATGQFGQTGQNLTINPLGNGGSVGNLVGRFGPGF